MKRQDITVLIVSKQHGSIYEKILSAFGFRVLPSETNGVDALPSIFINKPHVIMSEAILPMVDLYGMMLDLKGYPGVFICLSNCYSDQSVDRLLEQGVDYFCALPTDFGFVSRLIEQLVSEKYEQRRLELGFEMCYRFRLEEGISEILEELGMPSNLRGYKYIRKALVLAIEHKSLLDSFSKQLYFVLAETFQTSPNAIERAIRTAITTAWTRGNVEAQYAMFGYTVSDEKGKPTNKEFIMKIVEKLNFKLAMN